MTKRQITRAAQLLHQAQRRVESADGPTPRERLEAIERLAMVIILLSSIETRN